VAERGARIAHRLTDLAYGVFAGVVAILLLLQVNLPPRGVDWLSRLGLVLAALTPVLALASVVSGLASGIGWPLRSAIALILGIVVSIWPLSWWFLVSNCPGLC
jgi:hypothetical protein